MPFKRPSFRSRNSKSIMLSVAATILVATALYTFNFTKAAGFFASVDPSGGTLSGNATLQNDNDGINGKVVQFGAVVSEPPTEPPTTPPGTGPDLTKKNCIVKPSSCGYPDETNTGYKHTGLQEKDLTTNGLNVSSDGHLYITQAGTVLDGKKINGCVHVRAKNVTIKRSLITGCRWYYTIIMDQGYDTSNLLIEDVEVNGNDYEGTNSALVDDNGKGLVVRRMYMHHVAEGPHPGENWLIEDSYIVMTDKVCSVCHTDSIQSAGASNVTIRHNTIWNDPPNNGNEGGKNAVVRIATEQSPVDGFIVDNNLLDGGNFAVQVRGQGHGNPKNVKITNNRIVPSWRFGPYDFTDEDTRSPLRGVILTGNVRDDNLAPLNTY